MNMNSAVIINKKEEFAALNKYWIPALKHCEISELIKKGEQCDRPKNYQPHLKKSV